MMLKCLLATLLLTTSLYAADAPKAEEVKAPAPVFQKAGYNFAGVSLGIAKTAGTNIQQIPFRFNYGVDYSHAFARDFSVGVFAARNSGEAAEHSSADLDITRFGAQFMYGPVNDGFITLKAGMALVDYSARASVAKPIFIAPGFGIAYIITDKIQFLPSVNYTFFLENSDVKSFQMFDLAGSFRYQF